MTLETMRNRIQEAKEDFTRAEAIMGEVKKSMHEIVDTLIEVDPSIPKQKNMTDDDYYKVVSSYLSHQVETLEADIEAKKTELSNLISIWDTKLNKED